MRRLTLFILNLAILLLSGCLDSTGDNQIEEPIPWPNYRFDSSNTGFYPGEGPSTGQIVDTLVYLEGYIPDWAAPVIDERGNIYISDTYGNVSKFRSDGTLEWVFATGKAIRGGSGCLIDSVVVFNTEDHSIIGITRSGILAWSIDIADNSWIAPVANQALGFVVTLTKHGYLYAYGSDGNLIYSYYFGENTISPVHPAIDEEGNCYVAYGKEVYSLSPSGAINWHFTYDTSYATIRTRGLVLTPNDQIVFAAQGWGDHRLVCIDKNNGDLLWVVIRHNVDYLVSSLAVDPDGNIYVTNYFGSIDKYNPEGELIAQFAVSDDENAWPWPGVTLDVEGNIYYSTVFGKKLVSLDKNGNVNWELNLSKGWLWETVLFNGKLYVATDWSNHLTVIE